MRRLSALAILGLLLALAVGVLYRLGLGGLEAEAQRLEGDARQQRRQALEEIRDELAHRLEALTDREGSRPYYHYRHLYLDPELVASEPGLLVSKIARGSPEPLIAFYLEFRDGQLTSPAFQTSDLEHEEAPTPYAEAIREPLLELRSLSPVFQARLIPDPVRELATEVVAVDQYCFEANMDPAAALQTLERAQYDAAARGKLKGDWDAYQTRQGKRGSTYVPMNQQRASGPREDVPITIFPFRWLRQGLDAQGWPEHLLALRRIEATDGRAWLQGFAVDVARLRAQLGELIANSDLPGPAGAGERITAQAAVACEPADAASAAGRADEGLQLQPPLETLRLHHTTPPLDRRQLLARSRSLLDGSLLLVVVVVLLGGSILIQAALAERRLARQRSDFVAALTHELKAPLTGVRALAELLRDGIVTGEEKRQEYYASILGESERLSRLVQNVLDASRLERGAPLSTSIQPVDAASLLRELAGAFRPRLESEGFRLELDLPDLPPLQADPEAFQQIVANLLDNGTKYGRGELKEIRLTAAVEEGRLAVRVADQGPGVPAEDRARVFRRFFRSQSAPGEVGGAGLGLAIARAQAEAMQGTLELEDAPRGACFRLSLPLADEDP